MKYTVVIADLARSQFDELDARWLAVIIAAMRTHLQYDPRRESKSRIKRLRALRKPQFRLRVDALRVFYDVDDEKRHVAVVGIVDKDDAANWLRIHGEEST